MPITLSTKKALRQSFRRKKQNLKKKEAYKTVVKNLKKLVPLGKKDEAKKLLPALYQALDKAAKTGAIKKNKASRLKSRLTRLLKKQ